MIQLFPILIIAILLLAERGPGFLGPAPDGPAGWVSLTAAFAPVIAVALVAAAVVRWADRRLVRGRPQGTIAVVDRTLGIARWILVLAHANAVFLFGWFDAVRAVVGNHLLGDELIAITPPIAGAIALWWLHFPIERRLREAVLIRQLDEGRPVYAMPRRSRYVLEQTRMHLLLLLVPVLLILALSELIRGALIAWGETPVWLADVATTVAGLGVLFFAPLIARLVLRVERLAPGSVRDDLAAICDRHGIRVRDYLLWRTDGTMINAAVMGFVGPLRYVLLTDALIDMMTEREVKAVMAHEIGHVKRRHMPWLLLSLLALLMAASMLVSLPLIALEQLDAGWLEDGLEDGSGWIDGLGTAGAALLALGAFGWVSRRYERQADTFAVQHLSGLGDDVDAVPAVTPDAVADMQAALSAVARLNTVDPQRRSWRHGSIAWRQQYLATTVGRPIDGLPIDRFIRRAKGIVAVVLILGLGATAALAWDDDGAPVETVETEPVPPTPAGLDTRPPQNLGPRDPS